MFFFLWNTLKKWINCLLARWLSLWKSSYSHFKCCKWNVVLHYPHMTSHMFFQKYSKNKLCLMYCLQSKFPSPGLKFWEGILLEWENIEIQLYIIPRHAPCYACVNSTDLLIPAICGWFKKLTVQMSKFSQMCPLFRSIYSLLSSN